jgi:branched-chain amino acid transport system permease protein
VTQDRNKDVNNRLLVSSIGKLTKPGFWLIGAVVVFLLLLPVFLKSPYLHHIFILILIYTITTSSFRAISISGQFPLAHAAFMGIGAYVSGMISKWLGWSPWLSIPSAGVVTMLIGVMMGYPFVRLKTIYYALGSAFFGLGIIQIIYIGGKWTGGYNGLYGIPALLPDIGNKVPYYYLFLGLAVVCLIALYRFEFSRIGTNLKAISQSDLVASSIGINVGRYRVMAVAVGCFFVGIAGAGYAHYNLVVSASSFNFLATLWIVMYVLTGGIDSFYGPMLGTFILIFVPEYFRGLLMYSPYISAFILLIVIYVMPRGLISLPQIISAGWQKYRKGRRVSHASGD